MMAASLAGTAGFIALAYEIVWYHIFSFATGGRAFTFAILLGCYLLGVAYGSLSVRDVCRQKLRHNLPGTLRGAAIVACVGSVHPFGPTCVMPTSTLRLDWEE